MVLCVRTRDAKKNSFENLSRIISAKAAVRYRQRNTFQRECIFQFNTGDTLPFLLEKNYERI